MEAINYNDLPEDIREEFKHCDIVFQVSEFEEMMLNDIYQHDESTKIKLNRNVTDVFFREFEKYHDQKRNIRYNIKGETRDGKSYVGLKFMDLSFDKQGISFNEKSDYYTCGNQIEYRQKLQNAKFGEFYLIDENFFTRAGLGANIEATQMTDYNNIIAKKNIGSVFITPQKFLSTGAVLGFATYGRDSNNWLTRCLLFKFKDGFPYLMGYIVLDIGALFRKHGCLIYKFTGGCTNSKRVEIKDINEKFIKYSFCIPDEFKIDSSNLKLDRDEDGNLVNCPYYEVCTHGVCRYERKKDSWIDKEMKGGLDERTEERFRIACELILELSPTIIPENNIVRVKAKNGKDLKNRVKLKIHKFSNAKMGIAEFDELLEIIKSNTDISMLSETLVQLGDENLIQKFINIDEFGIIKEQVEESRKREESKKEESQKEKTI